MRGGMFGLDLARELCLPFKVIEESLKFLKDEKCLEVAGGDLIGRVSYRFNLTELGRRRAQEAMKLCAYVGPAPGAAGRLRRADLSPGRHRHLLQPRTAQGRLRPSRPQGRAVQRARPGHRQRQVRLHLRPARQRQDLRRPVDRRLHEQRRRRNLRPLRLLRREQHHHASTTRPCTSASTSIPTNAWRTTKPPFAGCSTPAPSTPAGCAIRRPVVVTGGELNLDMLDLALQLAARTSTRPRCTSRPTAESSSSTTSAGNCAVPRNCSIAGSCRWKTAHDFLTVASGKKFEVPFEQLIIFSTNLDPKDLVDDAFLRRIRHKVGIDAPPRDIYERILQRRGQAFGA